MVSVCPGRRLSCGAGTRASPPSRRRRSHPHAAEQPPLSRSLVLLGSWMSSLNLVAPDADDDEWHPSPACGGLTATTAGHGTRARIEAAPAEQVVPADLLCSFLTTGGDVGPAVMETVRQILAAPGDGQGRRQGDD